MRVSHSPPHPPAFFFPGLERVGDRCPFLQVGLYQGSKSACHLTSAAFPSPPPFCFSTQVVSASSRPSSPCTAKLTWTVRVAAALLLCQSWAWEAFESAPIPHQTLNLTLTETPIVPPTPMAALSPTTSLPSRWRFYPTST